MKSYPIWGPLIGLLGFLMIFYLPSSSFSHSVTGTEKAIVINIMGSGGKPIMANIDLDIIIKTVGGLLTFIAVMIGIWQYRKGQKWQKAQILISLIESFEKNNQIRLACKMIDWDKRKLITADGVVINFENKLLVNALKVVKMDDQFNKDEIIIRDAFDAFFDFFDKLYALKKSKLLKMDDYFYFYYWFSLLKKIGAHKEIKELQKIFENYIKKYQFEGIDILMKEHKGDLSFEEERIS